MFCQDDVVCHWLGVCSPAATSKSMSTTTSRFPGGFSRESEFQSETNLPASAGNPLVYSCRRQVQRRIGNQERRSGPALSPRGISVTGNLISPLSFTSPCNLEDGTMYCCSQIRQHQRRERKQAVSAASRRSLTVAALSLTFPGQLFRKPRLLWAKFVRFGNTAARSGVSTPNHDASVAPY